MIRPLMISLALGTSLLLGGCSSTSERAKENSLSHLVGWLQNAKGYLKQTPPDFENASKQVANLVQSLDGLAFIWDRMGDMEFTGAVATVEAKAKELQSAVDAKKETDAAPLLDPLGDSIDALKAIARKGAAPKPVEVPKEEAPKVEPPKVDAPAVPEPPKVDVPAVPEPPKVDAPAVPEPPKVDAPELPKPEDAPEAPKVD